MGDLTRRSDPDEAARARDPHHLALNLDGVLVDSDADGMEGARAEDMLARIRALADARHA